MARIFTRQEVKRRRMKFQIFAGMYDFVAVVAGLIVVIACVVLLSSLFNWIVRDAQTSFITLWEIANDAVILPQ